MYIVNQVEVASCEFVSEETGFVFTMSLRPFSKLLKPFKKSEKQDAEFVPIPYEGLDLSIKLLLAYVGKEAADVKVLNLQNDTSDNGKEKVNVDSQCGIHGTAILRCLGKCHGLSGADPFEDLEIDQIVEVFNEFRIVLLTIENAEKLNESSAEIATVEETEALGYLAKFDAVIATNRGHLALNKLTWADFLVVGVWDRIKNTLGSDVVTKFPNIAAMVRNISSKTSSRIM